MGKKQSASFAGVMEGHVQPASASIMPESKIPYTPGDDFDVEGTLKDFNLDFPDPNSKDLYTEFGGKWYSNVPQGPEQRTVKGDNQPWTSKLFNGILGNTASIFTKIGTQVGEVGGGLFDLITTPIPGVAETRKKQYGTIVPHMYENFVTEAIDTLENDLIKERLLPVYGGSKYQSDSILKMMGDMKFWSSDLADSVAFTIASYAPVGAFGKVAKGMKMVTGVEGAQKLNSTGKLFTTAATTVWNTFQESTLEAKQGLDVMRESLAGRLYNTSYDSLQPEQKAEINSKAGPHAANIFTSNLAVLAGPNLIQSMFFIGPVKSSASRLMKAVRSGKIGPDDISKLKKTLTLGGLGVMSEGAWEEGLQNAVQNYEQKRATGDALMNRSTGYLYEWLNGFYTTEGQQSMLSGALVGGIMGARRGYLNAKEDRKFVTDYKNKYDKIIKDSFSFYDNELPGNIKHFYKTYKQEVTDKDGNKKIIDTIFNEDGQADLDLDKISKLYAGTLNQRSSFNQRLMASLNMDEVGEKFAVNESLLQWFHDYMTNDIFEDNDSAFDTMMERSGIKTLSEDEDISKLGLDYKYLVTQANKMKSVWDNIDKNLYNREDLDGDKTRQQFKEKVAKGILYERMKLDLLDQFSDVIKDKAQIEVLRKDANERLGIFENSTERDKLFKIYKEELNRDTELREQLKQATTKDPNSVDTKKLQYLIDEESQITGNTVTNDMFSFIARPKEKTGEFGLRNQHYLNVGSDAITGMRLEAEINKVEEGRSGFKNVVDILLNPALGSIETRGKYDITTSDLDAVKALIPIEKQRIEEESFSQEDYGKEMNAISASIQTEEITFEEAQVAKQLVEERFQLSEERKKEFEKALEDFNNIDPNKDGKGLLNYKDNIAKEEVNDYSFMRVVSDIPVNDSNAAIKAYQASKSTYDSLKRVEGLISELEDRKKIYIDTELKDRLTQKAFKGYIESIDKSIKELKDILPEVEKNFKEKQGSDSRYQKNNNKKRFNAIGITFNEKNEPIITDKVIYDSVVSIIGQDELNKILSDAKSSSDLGDEYANHEVFVDKILLKVKEEEKKKKTEGTLRRTVEQRYKENKDTFEKNYNDHVGKLMPADKRLIKKYNTNPRKLFRTVIQFIAGYKPNSFTDKTAIDRYFIDNDIFSLRDNLSIETDIGYNGTTKDKLLLFIDQHITIEAYQDILENLNSEFDTESQIKAEETIYLDKKKAPTNQQISVIRKAIRWALSPLKKVNETEKEYHRFRNWLFIKGVAGTGKTQFVMDFLIKSLGIKSNEFVTLAPHENAAKMINNSVTGSSTILIKDITSDSIPSDTKFVFIDEVAALNNPQLVELSNTLQDINDKRQKPFRVVVFGDPSQVSAQEDGIMNSVDPIINRDITNGSEYMDVTDPLTIRHRSIIPELNEILDIFEGNEKEVEGITVNASNFIGYQSIGVHAGTRDQLRKMIEVHKGNGKTKAIVVYSLRDKNNMIESFPDMKDSVFTYSEVAGMEFDEVYVNLSPDQFKDSREFNKAYYTAMSRAKQYIFLYDKNNSFKVQAKQSIRDRFDKGEYQKEQKEIFDKRREQYEKRIEVERNVLTGTKTKKEKKEKEVVETDIKTKDIEDIFEGQETEDSTGRSEEDSEIKKEGINLGVQTGIVTHTLKFPSYVGSKFIKKTGNTGRLIPNGDVIYIKTEDKTQSGPYTIHILGQLYNPEGNIIPNRYAHLGIIGEEELSSEFGKELMDKADKSVNEKGEELFNNVIIDGTSDVANLKFSTGEVFEKTVLSNGKLSLASPLAYRYSDKVTYSGEGMINKIIDLFNHRYLDRAKERASYHIEIFTNNNKPEGRFAGIPYLVIEPVSKRGMAKKTQYIALNPRKLRKTDNITQNLAEFTKSLSDLETYTKGRLGTDTFNEMISMFSRNYYIKGEDVEFSGKNLTFKEYDNNAKRGYVIPLDKNEFNHVSDIITPVIKGIYGKGSVKKKIGSEDEMITEYKLKKVGDSLEDDNYFYEFKPSKWKSSDGVEHDRGYGYVVRYAKGDKKSKGTFEYEDGLVSGDGKAQTYLNILAKANHFIGDKSIRVKKRTRRAKGDKTIAYTISAKSLLDTKEYMSGYYRMIREMFKSNNLIFNYEVVYKDGSTRMREERFIDDDNVTLAEEYLVKNGLATKEELDDIKKQYSAEPITSDILRSITEFEGDSHPFLRKPLEMTGKSGINTLGSDLDGNRELLEDLLESNIEDILQTEIRVAVNKSTEVKETKVEEPTEDEKKLGSRARKVASKVFKGINKKLLSSAGYSNLGSALSEDKIRKMIRKQIPGITDKEIIFLEKQLINRLAGEEAWGLYQDGIIYLAKNEDGTVYQNIARHEVFHKIYNEFLTPEERNKIDEEARKEFKDYNSYSSIEELLAVKFHEWRRGTLKQIGDYFRKLFQKILRFLNLYENNLDTINSLFHSIENGFIETRYSRGDNVTREMRDIRNKFKTITNYTESLNYIRAMLKEYRNDGIDGYPASRGEITDQIMRDTISRIKELKKYVAKDPNPLMTYELDKLLMITRNWKSLFEDLFTGFNNYSNGSYKTSLEEEELEQLIDEGDEENTVNLNKHIIENSKYNSEVDVSDDIREFLSYIENDKGDFLSWRYAYVKLIDMMQGLRFDQDNFMDQVKESFRTDKLTLNEEAIFSHIKGLKDIVDDNLFNGTKIPDTIKFLSSDIFIYGDKSVQEIKGVSDPRILSGIVKVVNREDGENTKDFVKRVSLLTSIDSLKTAQQLKRSEARNLLARLVSHFNSHRQRNPKVGEMKSSYGAYNMRYFNSRGNAVANGIRTAIASQISSTFQEYDNIKKFIPVIKSWDEKYFSDPLTFVKNFLKYIGLNEYTYGLRNKNMNTIKNDISNFFDRAEKILGKEIQKSDTPEDSDLSDDNEVGTKVTIGKVIHDEGSGLLSRLTEQISLLDDISRILSSQDAERKKRYNAVLTSQAHNNLFAIANTRFREKSVGDLLKLNLRDIFKSKFFSHNIFIKGINNIYSVIDHDGITRIERDGSYSARMYESENNDAFFMRSFNFGFLSSIATSRKKAPHYIQYIYPNERKTLFGIETDVLGRDKLISSIEHIILQMHDRERISKVEGYNPESTIGFEVVRELLGDKEVGLLTMKDIKDLSVKVYESLDEKSKNLTKMMIDNKVPFDSDLNGMTKASSIIDKSIYGEWNKNSLPVNKGGYLQATESWDQFDARNKEKGIDRTNYRKFGVERQYRLKEEHIQPFVSLFYINNYINGYSFAQLAAGDMTSFKSNRDLIHRLPMAFAPGKTGLVNDRYGMKRYSRVAVIQDPVNSIDSIEEQLKRLLKEEDVSDVLSLFDKEGSLPGDGQGYMLPERAEEISYAFGNDFGNVLKPQYYNIDETGQARGLKYSTVVLSDDLTKNHNALRILRDKMRNHKENGVSAPIDEIVFTSAMKIGKPVVKNDWFKLTDSTQEIDIDPESVFILDNRDYRIQLDASADLDASVAHPSQLAYMTRLYGINDEVAQDIYNSISKIIQSNHDSLSSWMQDKSFNSIIKNFTNKKGQENLHELLLSGIDHNFPSISDRLLIHYISTVFKRSVRVRYPGSKLVLQSAKGIEKNFKDIKLPEHLQRELQYKKDEKGHIYAECIIPEGFLPKDIESRIKEALEKGKEPDDFFFAKMTSKDLLGFRMPTSDLHSAVPLKVVGFYDSKKTNVIIVPELLVPLHGSDFDVDSLFVIQRSFVNAYDRKTPVGYTKDGDQYKFDYDPSFLDQIEKDKLKREVTEVYYLNRVLEDFLSIITDEKNNKRMLSPISLNELKNERDRMLKLTKEKESSDIDVSDIIEAQKIHKGIFSGKVAIGMFMSQVKAFAFLHKSLAKDKITKLKRVEDDDTGEISISFNGKKYNQMTDYDEEGKESGYRFDSLGNSALDDFKVNILAPLNLTMNTIRSYSVLVMHGIKTKTINDFITQPVLRYLSENGIWDTDGLRKRIGESISQEELDNITTLNDEEMEKYLKYKPEDIKTFLDKDKLTKIQREFIVYQAKVYDQYKQINKLGKALGELTQIVNINRKFPNNIAEMEKILHTMKSITGIPQTGKITDTPNDNKSTFPYFVEDFFDANPHVYSALRVMQWIVDNVNKEFISYSKEFRDIAGKVLKDTDIVLERFDKTTEVNKKRIRDEFVKLLMSTLINRDQIEPVNATIKRQNVTLTGINAFNKTFIDLVQKAKRDDYRKKIESSGKDASERYDGNIFLNTLGFSSSRHTGQKTITFSGPSTMDVTDTNLFRESFEAMNDFDYKKVNGEWTQVKRDEEGYSEFQKMFVTYAMINYGMNFGLRNYSSVLPGEIYKNESDRLISLMADIKNLNNNERNNVINAFEIQLVTNYPDSLVENSVDVPAKVTKIIAGEKNDWIRLTHGLNPDGVYFDKWFESEVIRKWPKYHVIKSGEDVKIFLRTSSEEGLAAYYTRIGSKNNVSVYDAISLDKIRNYDIDEQFNQKIRHLKGHVTTGGLYETKYDINVGDLVSITEYNDPAKMEPKTYEVTEKKASDVYKLKEATGLKTKAYFERSGSEAEKVYSRLSEFLKAKKGPFRAGKRGKIYFKKGFENQGRQLRLNINSKYFAGHNVIKETVASSGWQIYIDIDEIRKWQYGEQLNLFKKGFDIDSIFSDKIWNDLLDGIVEIDEGLENKIKEYGDIYNGRTAEQLLDDIEQRTKNLFTRNIIKWIRPFIKELKPEYIGHRNLTGTRLAEFNTQGEFSIDYYKNALLEKSIDNIDRTIIHELLHGLTIIQFQKDSAFKQELENKILMLMASNPGLAQQFPLAFKDSEEFISELFADEVLFNTLNDLKINYKQNILRDIIDWILGFFGIKSNYHTADRMMNWIKNNIKPESYEKKDNEDHGRLYNKREIIDLIIGNRVSEEMMDETRMMLARESNEEFDRMAEKAGFNKIGKYWTVLDVIDIESKGYEDPLLNQVIDQGLEYSIPLKENGEEEDYYISKLGKKLRRVADIYTGWLSLFRKVGDKKTFGEREADSMWRFTDKEVSKITDGKEPESYDHYKEKMDKVMLEAATRAKIIHAIDQRYIDRVYNGGKNEGLINSKIQSLAYKDHVLTDSTGKTYTISINLDPESLSWYEDSIEEIYKAHKINIFDKIPDNLKDVLASEVTVANEDIGFVGTIDKLIKHSDDTLSIRDINTGTNFDRSLSSRLMRYGDQNRMLMDNPRDRKKLQIMTYAFIIKSNNPDIKFRDLSVMWIPNKWQATHYDQMRRVEVDDFLSMMKSFLQDKEALKEARIDENIYKILTDKSPHIFDPTHYTHEFTMKEEGLGVVSETIIRERLTDDLMMSDDPPHIVAKKKIDELTRIIGKAPVITKLGKSQFEKLSETDKTRARLLTTQILQLIRDPQTTLYLNPDTDVSLVTAWIGNYYDMNVSQVNVWKKFRDEQEQKARMSHYYLFNKMQSFLKPVIDDYYKKHPSLTGSKRLFNNANYKKIYGFAYKEFDNNGSNQLRLLTKSDKEYNDLTSNQQKLIDFLNEAYGSYFGKDSYTDQIATYIPEYGKLVPISIMDLFNKNLSEGKKIRYYQGWFPKIGKEDSEMIYDAGEGNYFKGLFSKEYLKESMHKTLTYYMENQYEGRQSEAMVLPLKYMGSFSIDNSRDYSYNLEFQFDRFIKSIEYKKNMDSVYALGESIRGWLDMQTDKDQPIYANTVAMFERKLTQDVLGRSIRSKLSRKPINLPASLFGKEYEDREIRADAVFTLMRRWVSATTMWLKPFTGGGNGIHATYLKHKDGIKGTISAKLLGIENDAVDYTLSDSLFADGIYFKEHIKNAMLGKIRQDKTWLLLKKLNYLPDNFDFMSSEKYLTSLRNRVISESTMYSFHRYPEEFVAMTTMIAQLKHLKHPTIKFDNGKQKSIWDLYEVEKDSNGEWDVVWKGGTRGQIKKGSGDKVSYEPISELLPEEIRKLKRVYERMQGGYRKEEAAAMEVYILGRVVIQLKKYAPRLILNAFHSKRNEIELGMLKDTGERKEGETVYEWIARQNEGKYRILGKFFLSTIMMSNGNRDYKWSNMAPEMKQHIVDACLTLGMWMTSYAAYITMFGDDKDDDTMKKWWKMYLIDNLSQQYNPLQLLTIVKQMMSPVALTKTIDTIGAAGQMIIAGKDYLIGNEDAFTERGDIRGWNNFKKGIPLLASYYDALKRVENISDLDVQFGKYR